MVKNSVTDPYTGQSHGLGQAGASEYTSSHGCEEETPLTSSNTDQGGSSNGPFATSQGLSKKTSEVDQFYVWHSAAQRLSLWTRIILVGGLVAILASIGFLVFLWVFTADNSLWHRLATSGWMARTITLTALTLRTAITLQAAVATSMLAAILLERRQVLAYQLTQVSALRNANTGPLGLAKLCLEPQYIGWGTVWWQLIILILALTIVLSQFTSTALVGDLQSSSIPGDQANATWPTNMMIDPENPNHRLFRGSSWLQKPYLYPVFAEYGEPALGDDNSISDTGHLLRAFLPFKDQQTRYNLHTYSGLATVIDARVVCMRPQLLNPRLHRVIADPANPSYGYLALTAAVSTSGSVDGFNENVTLGRTFPFIVGTSYVGCFSQPYPDSTGYWGLSICQINQPGGLFSAFGQMGHSYMVLNLTSGRDWNVVDDGSADDPTANITSAGMKPTSLSGRGEWLDLDFPVLDPDYANDKYRLSVSICYTGYDSADIPVKVLSTVNRTEPGPTFDTKTNQYRFDRIRAQLGQQPNGDWSFTDFTDRGIMKLEKLDSWNPKDIKGAQERPWGEAEFPGLRLLRGPILSPLVNAAKFEGPGFIGTEFDDTSAAMTSPISNYSALLNVLNSGNKFYAQDCSGRGQCGLGFIVPDPFHSLLMQEILLNGGDIAHALSSIITVLSGSAYYDQIFQFDKETPIARDIFIPTLVPRLYRGFFAVIVVTAIHLINLFIVILVFSRKTSISRIGEAWQNLAQLWDPAVEGIISKIALASDNEVREVMNQAAADSGEDDSGPPRLKKDPEALVPHLGPYDRVGIMLSEDRRGTRLVVRYRDSKAIILRECKQRST
ncbi:MAG: hypothetical protein Q9160_009205 [Pyrenula sp. 1 TL-2023]